MVDSKKLKMNTDINDFDTIKEISTSYSYLIMPRYGINLFKLFNLRKGKFTNESIYSLGLQLLDILEQIHRAGHVFNDLKLDNMMLDLDYDDSKLKTSQENIFEKNKVTLIDFGFATTYIDEESQQHIKKKHLGK